MKITLADKFIAWLTLLCGLSLSAVAIYYSVAGLVSIFAAAVVPIVIMGAILEISKLVATVWLKQNWFVAPRAIKAYLLIAITLLMFITSMGIFGYLSKAHMDQSVVSGDVQSKIALYDEKIKTEKENIDAARKALSQMDAQVNERLSRSSDDKGAERAVQIRRQQQAERARLQKDIASAQSNISRLNEERAPIAAEVRKVEAEVGPIKYIAALLYGDNPDANLLEAAVRWVIIMIVVVFDPLAVILLLASQYSFQWFRQNQEDTENTPDPYIADVGEKPTEEEKDDFLPTYEEITPKDQEPIPHHPDTHPYLRQGFKYPEGWGTIPPLVGKPAEGDSPQVEANIASQTTVTEISKEEIDQQLQKDLEETTIVETDEEKEARRRWKEEHPDSTIKKQEYLKEVGRIDKLPWEEEPKKKSSYITRESDQQVKKHKE